MSETTLTEAEARRESNLRKVRALIAKADATPFAGEADSFRAKAQELMDKFMITEWELAQKTGDRSLLQAERRDMDASWWVSGGKDDLGIGPDLMSMFKAVARHCNCVVVSNQYEFGGYDYAAGKSTLTVPVFGLRQDLDFLDMLFTSLMVQMLADFKPTYDPQQSLGENIYRAKEVGMKWTDIALWVGRPDWVIDPGYGAAKKTADHGKMKKEYYKVCAARGEKPITVNPKTYIRSYAAGFVGRIAERLREMRSTEAQEEGTSMALAIRDAKQISQEAAAAAFAGVKSKALSKRGGQTDWTGMARGGQAGSRANIASRNGGLKQRGQLES